MALLDNPMGAFKVLQFSTGSVTMLTASGSTGAREMVLTGNAVFHSGMLPASAGLSPNSPHVDALKTALSDEVLAANFEQLTSGTGGNERIAGACDCIAGVYVDACKSVCQIEHGGLLAATCQPHADGCRCVCTCNDGMSTGGMDYQCQRPDLTS